MGGTTVGGELAPLKGDAPKAGDYFGGHQLARRLWKRMPLMVASPVGHRVTTWIG
jgi:hypothetical protein